MEYHDEFGSQLLSFIIDQLKLLCIPEQARRYTPTKSWFENQSVVMDVQ